MRFFEGDRHEILNEIDREEVYQYLLDWLEAHLT
jgi:alpha-beta hydrolase superfamily lysophospholipase